MMSVANGAAAGAFQLSAARRPCGEPEDERCGPGGIGAGGGPGARGAQRVRLGAGGAAQERGREPAQVVEQRRHGVGDGEGGEPCVAAVDGGGEDLELADDPRNVQRGRGLAAPMHAPDDSTTPRDLSPL